MISGHLQEVNILSKILYVLLESSISFRSFSAPICIPVFPLCQSVWLQSVSFRVPLAWFQAGITCPILAIGVKHNMSPETEGKQGCATKHLQHWLLIFLDLLSYHGDLLVTL